MEGWLRRELELAGATLRNVAHQSMVHLQWSIPQSLSAELIARINEGGQGRIAWLEHWPDSANSD